MGWTMNANDLKAGGLFTTNGLDAWKMEGYFLVPSCTLVNLETGEKQTFGMGGLISANFKPLVSKETP